jgi:hypothetical protein
MRRVFYKDYCTMISYNDSDYRDVKNTTGVSGAKKRILRRMAGSK